MSFNLKTEKIQLHDPQEIYLCLDAWVDLIQDTQEGTMTISRNGKEIKITISKGSEETKIDLSDVQLKHTYQSFHERTERSRHYSLDIQGVQKGQERKYHIYINQTLEWGNTTWDKTLSVFKYRVAENFRKELIKRG